MLLTRTINTQTRNANFSITHELLLTWNQIHDTLRTVRRQGDHEGAVHYFEIYNVPIGGAQYLVIN